MALKKTLLTTPLLFLLACSGDPSVGPGSGDDSSGGDDNITTSTRVAGNYEVTSSYDLTTSSALPDVVSDVVLPLSNLSDNPTGTIIDLIKATDSPAADLIDKIPPVLLGVLEATMNNLIEDKLFDGQPVVGEIAEYTDLVASIIMDFDVITELEVGTADDAGNANANHKLVGFAFERDEMRVVVEPPELLGTLAVARDVSVNVDLDGRSIDIGNHALELPLGDIAVYGLNAAIAATTDFEDLGDALGGVVNCPSIAAEIGPLCISSICVADEDQVSGLCEFGLDMVAAEVEKQIKKIDVAQLRMMGGQAKIVADSKSDTTGDSAVSAMNSGSWDTEFGISDKVLPLQSDFEARRID